MRRYDDPVGTIQVAIGEDFAIALAGNPTTGYEWRATADPEFLKAGTKDFEPGGKAVGAGGRDVFRFRALRAGETELVFEYRRPWETTPRETRRCRLVVVDRPARE